MTADPVAERRDEYLDAAELFTPESYPAGALNLPAYCLRRRLYERGVMSADEWNRYQAAIDNSPLSWWGWWKTAVRWQEPAAIVEQG
jgi:hypothetical protein